MTHETERDKLAEESLKERMLKTIFDELEQKSYDIDFHGYHYKEANQVIRRYFEILINSHEAKLKEITDSDIEAWANRRYEEWINDIKLDGWIGSDLLFEGAKAMRDGEIKHIEK